ncbi:hypothetical protein ACFRKB_01025 [Streptomyces scopuliridis]|uniref:hypothetical protein n=1 Tax=Streptomyces scopuliridis TaxID=452529 RepID=UPI0036C37FEE
MREKMDEANETVSALAHIIATLEGIVASNALWEKVAVPEPRAAGEQESGARASAAPGETSTGEAEDLASHAEDSLGARQQAGQAAAPQPGKHGRREHPPWRVQILTALAADPSRWWPAQELSEAVGVTHHRRLRGILSEMVREGYLERHKESAGTPASYRPAPQPAPQEETVMSG